MDIADFVDFSVGLCYFVIAGFYYIFTSLLATGKFLYLFFSNGCNGAVAALDYASTCTGGSIVCTLKALHFFIYELGKTLNNNELQPRLWQILICIIVIFIPFLREIVSTCLTFFISLVFTLLFKIYDASRHRRRRRVFERNNRPPLCSATNVKEVFKRLFGSSRFKRPLQSQPKHKAKKDINQDGVLNCIICYEKPKCVVLLPCKHACLCVECANGLLKRQMLCPLCRKLVVGTMHIYI